MLDRPVVQCGVMVAGAHGWGPVKRLVSGSVSSSLLHEAPCPVIVVREDVPVFESTPAFGETSGEADREPRRAVRGR